MVHPDLGLCLGFLLRLGCLMLLQDASSSSILSKTLILYLSLCFFIFLLDHTTCSDLSLFFPFINKFELRISKTSQG